jgi:hypothetical protein
MRRGENLSKIDTAISLLVIIGIIAIAIYTFIIAVDLRIDPINPHDETYTITSPLTMYWGNIAEKPDIEINIVLTYNGTLVPNKPVLMTTYGYLNTEVVKNVTFAQIGFKLGLAWPPHNVSETYKMPQEGSIDIFSDGNGNLSENSTLIYWSIPGDFVPSVVVHQPIIVTGSNGKIYPLEFPNYAVHVEPMSELLSEKFNRITVGLAYSATFLVFIEAILLIRKLAKGLRKK